MNDERRKKIRAILETLSGLRNELEELATDEREAFDAMPEGLQESDRGQKASECADALENATSDIEGLESSLEECLS